MKAIAVILSGFPRRSETFAVNELAALERAGHLVAIFATKPGDGAAPHADAARLAKRVVMLRPGSANEQANQVTTYLHGTQVAGIHGYFAHTPADVAARAAARLGVRYGFSAHARDVRKVHTADLERRARDAAIVVACNPDVAATLAQRGVGAVLIPHGVDTERFAPTRTIAKTGALRLLSVGRLVPKKGFGVLLSAVATLELLFTLRIIGDGPDAVQLQRTIDEWRLGDRVTLCGSRAHDDLRREYSAADIVVVPSIEDRTGDRDGLPNVLLEAMACGRTVLATRMGAIASAVQHGRTGWLVNAGDPAELARAIRVLHSSLELRERLGREARGRAEQDFALRRCTDRLRQALEVAYA
jgi:glycosyltransferase involved in cell wall biosynthesis